MIACKSYISIFAISALLFIALIGVTNWIIDPYFLWGTSCIDGFSCKKTEAGNKIYLTKANQWRGFDPDGIILGNSRTEIGIDPESSFFNNKKIYNLSIRGSSISRQATYLMNILKYHNPEFVILGVDFFPFRQPPDYDVKWPPGEDEYLPYNILGEENSRYVVNNIKSRLQSLLAIDSLTGSVKTVLNQKRKVSYLRSDGFRKAEGFKTVIRHEGISAAFANDEKSLFKKFNGNTFVLRDRKGVSRDFRALKVIFDELNKRGIKLYIFINPVHIRYLDILHNTGHFDLYLQWKKELVSELQELDYFNDNELIDFGGVNKYTVEAVPQQKNMPMQWFYEAGHYTPVMGNVILQELFDENPDYLLSPDNINEKVLQEKSQMQIHFTG